MLQIEWNTATIIAEVFYCVIGAIFAATGFNALTNKDCEKPVTTAIFWFLIAVTFMVGPYIPTWITGLIVVLLAVLSGLGLVKPAQDISQLLRKLVIMQTNMDINHLSHQYA